jgi:hypothetical protein
VPLLLLKLVLTPLIVGGASIASRRWGPVVGGWIVSLPLTSGPILFFLALGSGPEFAAEAATGTLLGMAGICAFSLGYLALSRRGPLLALLVASACYAAVAVTVQPILGWPFALLAVLVLAAITGTLRVLPAPAAGGPAAHPRWDLPARIIIGTTLVVTLTAVAPLLGPTTSGLVATFPVYVSILAVFEHARTGRDGALSTLRGLMTGLYGTVSFYVAVHYLVEPLGVAVAFSVAVAAALLVGGIALRVLRATMVVPQPEPETI